MASEEAGGGAELLPQALEQPHSAQALSTEGAAIDQQTQNPFETDASKSDSDDTEPDEHVGVEGDDNMCAVSVSGREDGASAPRALPARVGAASDGLDAPSRKRKSPGDTPDASFADGTLKKVKVTEDDAGKPAQSSSRDVPQDKSLLAPEIWHHIFTFCPPKSLGNLLRVNKLFNLYLDPSSSVRKEVPVSLTRSALGFLAADSIWRASRRCFWPHMPTPLPSKTELDMWRLACSLTCQNCNRVDTRDRGGAVDLWRPGPGADGVAVIWSFAKRMCGTCLGQTCVKEIDLLLSSDIPSALVPALPFVFLTQELDVIPASTLKHGQLPADLQIAKIHSASNVRALKQEFLAVKDLGPGTAEEWLKGLSGRGKDHQHQVSRWEKWEGSGGLARMRTQLYPGHTEKPPVRPPTSRPASINASPTSPSCTHRPPGLPPIPPQPLSQARHERTMEEVVELKAARKAEIERRALLLDPPLTADELLQIPAFQAATQIITPLDDNAWDLLKPRLLAQRAEAEQREKENAAQMKAQQLLEERRRLETTLATTKEARDLDDKMWEEIQAPVRAKIAGYTDERIRENWEKGKKVAKDNCSKFAADVLVYVRRKFYAEVAKDAAAARAAGRDVVVDPPEGPFTQKLTLENMKWIFDTKIKPHTDKYRKELFYCNDCEGNPKTYGFEGVIQHYAAKHTSALSIGSIVVHWRAEWPEHPPFNTEGRRPKHAYYGHGVGALPSPLGVPPSNGHSYPPMFGPPAPPAYPPHPGPVYGGAPYVNDQPYQPALPPYPHAAPYPPPYTQQPSFGQQQSCVPHAYHSYQHPHQQPPAAGPYPPPGPDSVPVQVPVQGYAPPPPAANYGYNYGAYQSNAQAGYTAPPAPAFPDTYQTRLEDVARNSREVWQALSNIRDLPGSARVFATIYHVVKRFRSRFSDTPPLTLFIDGLSNHKDMRPVRNVNSLVCKACHLRLGNAASVQEDRKSFSLPQLTNHFQFKHVEPMQRLQLQTGRPPLDWVSDMVLLPGHAALANLRSNVGENQRLLLAEAFPQPQPHPHPQPAVDSHPYHAQQAQQAPYQHQPSYPGGYSAAPIDNQTASYAPPQPQTSNGPASGSHAAHGYPSGSRPAEIPPVSSYPAQDQPFKAAAVRADNYAPYPRPDFGYAADGDAVANQTLPALSQQHDRAANGESGRHSSHGSQHSRGKDLHQGYRKGNVRNRRGKTLDAGGLDREMDGPVAEEDAKRDEEATRREEAKIRAMWAADRVESARTISSPHRPHHTEKRERVPSTQAPPSTQGLRTLTPQQFQLASSQGPSAPPVSVREEPNLLAALEMHLEQRGAPVGPATGARAPSAMETAASHRPRSPNGPLYTNSRDSMADADARRAERMHARHAPDRDRSRSPAFGPRFYQQELPPRHRSPSVQLPEPVYYSRQRPDERPGFGYDPYPVEPGFAKQAPQRANGVPYEPYDRPPPRLSDRDYDVAMQPGYRRFHEDALPPPRQPVEAYEIVQVIDERGEYLIRRPARREPEPSYPYENERRHRRDVGPYAAYEAPYVPVSRPGPPRELPREPPRFSTPSEARRADPAYYEEYDPRFPAA
ncbi:hypothetical protein QBC46DRAFT_433449 [Diplogelasinospora grovesii]|uniref:DUF7892 domain-containing protein n=1 Tax=Diplogelasinospora grovesii TaxID=303347 RepID=A0AAN6NHJ8_9PEZI|nr:hypothetical protein QBC46DRAFT_433449 [Diplogelasinospora grovesii]